MYGPNADTLYKTIHPILTRVDFLQGAEAVLRYGSPENGVQERILNIANS